MLSGKRGGLIYLDEEASISSEQSALRVEGGLLNLDEMNDPSHNDFEKFTVVENSPRVNRGGQKSLFAVALGLSVADTLVDSSEIRIGLGEIYRNSTQVNILTGSVGSIILMFNTKFTFIGLKASLRFLQSLKKSYNANANFSAELLKFVRGHKGMVFGGMVISSGVLSLEYLKSNYLLSVIPDQYSIANISLRKAWRVFSFPLAGIVTFTFLMNEGIQSIEALKEYLSSEKVEETKKQKVAKWLGRVLGGIGTLAEVISTFSILVELFHANQLLPKLAIGSTTPISGGASYALKGVETQKIFEQIFADGEKLLSKERLDARKSNLRVKCEIFLIRTLSIAPAFYLAFYVMQGFDEWACKNTAHKLDVMSGEEILDLNSNSKGQTIIALTSVFAVQNFLLFMKILEEFFAEPLVTRCGNYLADLAPKAITAEEKRTLLPKGNMVAVKGKDVTRITHKARLFSEPPQPGYGTLPKPKRENYCGIM